MKATREFRPHSVECHTGQHGTLVRVCRNCGSSWFLKLHGDTHDYAWMPIAELTADGKSIEADVDVTYCYASETKPEPTPAPVQTAPKSDERKCFCGDCHKAGRKEHYAGDEMCYCPRHKGRERHKLA